MTPPLNAFVFAPKFNHKGNDATGAFLPGAKAFVKWCLGQNDDSARKLEFQNQGTDRIVFNEILHGLAISPYQLDAIAYFGHGTEDMMVSARIGHGFFDEFVASIRANAGMNVNIMLYACSCGVPGGFALKLATALSDLNATVYSHASVGHSFRNPMVRKFPGGTKVCPDGMVPAWRRAFADERNDLWIRFPFMTDDEIRAELTGS